MLLDITQFCDPRNARGLNIDDRLICMLDDVLRTYTCKVTADHRTAVGRIGNRNIYPYIYNWMYILVSTYLSFVGQWEKKSGHRNVEMYEAFLSYYRPVRIPLWITRLIHKTWSIKSSFLKTLIIDSSHDVNGNEIRHICFETWLSSRICVFPDLRRYL